MGVKGEESNHHTVDVDEASSSLVHAAIFWLSVDAGKPSEAADGRDTLKPAQKSIWPADSLRPCGFKAGVHNRLRNLRRCVVAKEIAMEDVSTISLAAMKAIEDGLKEFGITLTPEQEDEVYVPMSEKVEKLAGYPDYRHHL